MRSARERLQKRPQHEQFTELRQHCVASKRAASVMSESVIEEFERLLALQARRRVLFDLVRA